MISTVLYVAGVICLLLALLAFLGVFAIGTIGPVGLLILGIVLLAIAYLLSRSSTAGGRTRV